MIARGRIKVDARKALDKLRDHMLVDPHLWACEIARVAVALGASRLDVGWDTDELTFDFDGRALAVEQIAHARDHVLTPLDGPDGSALRVLGIGIGAALSLDPSYVEVLANGARVRFERNYMQDGDAAPTPSAAPNVLPPNVTTRVRFKRRLGLGLLARLTAPPAEIPLLEAAFEAQTCELRLRGTPVKGQRAPVMTVDLDVPGTTRAHLEILRHPTEARVDFCHHGVRLASSTVRGLWGLAVRPRAQLPIRVIVDTDDLPTNASRSHVRADAPLIDRAYRRIDAAFAVAVTALRGKADENAARIGHAVRAHAEAAVLTDVLGALAAEAAIAVRAQAPLEAAARTLLDDEVAFDALGRRISLSSLRGGDLQHPLRVHEGPEPLPADLAPWMSGTIWKRGLSAERALEGLLTASVKDVVEPALAAMSRRARALEHPASPPETAAAKFAWKERFTVRKGPFAGLVGEVAFLGPKGGDGQAHARLYVDERLLETVAVPGVRLPIELALAWPDHIIATYAYDAVERTEALTRALHYALRVAAMGVGRHPSEPALVRLAAQAWAEATRSLDDARVDPVGLAELAHLPAWRTTDDRLVTLDAIYAYGRKTGAVCYARAKKRAADGRIVVASEDALALRAVLGPDLDLVAYDASLMGDAGGAEPVPALAVLIQRPGLEGFVAPSRDRTSRLRVYHAGLLLRREVWPARNGPVDVVYVDHGAIPRVELEGFRYASPLPGLAAEEDALVELVTNACESDAVELDAFEHYLQESRAELLERKEKLELAKRIFALPARREQRRLDRLKAQVLQRAPLELDLVLGGRPRGTFVASGKGAVTVALAPLCPAVVLYQGHPVGTELVGKLDLEVFIDVVDAAFVHEWVRLSDLGRSWAEDAILEAATTLLENLSVQPGFADSEVALRLLLALLPESPGRAGRVVAQLPWPTVQGPATTLGDRAEMNTGVQVYASWQSSRDASPYDAPALHLPLSKVGELRRKVFLAAGLQLTDVTEATARLQTLRARSAASAPPALDGPPSAPMLRSSLAQLGATLLEGEVELIADGPSQIGRVGPDGVYEKVPMELGVPLRAIYRTETEDRALVVRELEDAVRRFLTQLAPRLETLPRLVAGFVARRVRAQVLAGVAQAGKMADADRDLPIFEATDGSAHPLSSLPPHVSFTTDPPPYPPVDDLVLCLGSAEASALAKLLDLHDDTLSLRARARGLAARAAPPLAAIRVREREKCLFFIEVNEEGVTGEIGLLHPNHTESRRIELHTTNRPLTFLPDPAGWPLLAALNQDGLAVDDAFAELLEPNPVTKRLHQLVRRIVASNLSRLLTTPGDVLGVVRLPVPLLLRFVRSRRKAAAMGVFWLLPEWPERPSIHVEGIGIVDPDRVPLLEAGPASRVVPIRGKLWVTAEAADVPRAIEDVMAWVSVRLPAHIRTVRHSRKGLGKYEWDLALLGVLEDETKDPVRELALDRPSADLMHVVARRAPHLVDRATGDAAPAPAPAPAAVLRGDEEFAPAPVAEGFLAGLVRRVTALVTGAPEVLEETPLTSALSEAIGALALTGQPVLVVQASKRGRPITYDRAARKLVVNAKHPVVEAHASRENGLLFLAIAALSEINRELAEVTDAEEVAKLLELLRARP